MRRFRSPAGALLLVFLCEAASQTEQSVNALFTSVRAMLRAHRPDAEVARLTEEQHLSERLDDAVIEQLQGEGAGPATVEALERQREVSHHLPHAATPQVEGAAAPSDSERAEALEKARAIANRYTAGLPDFVCTQTVRRYSTHQKAMAWKAEDVLKWEVGFSGKRERYRLLSVNGRPPKPDADRHGAVSSGEFGSILEMVYQPERAAKFEWERAATFRGRRAWVFSYAIAQAHSTFTLNDLSNNRHIAVALRGLVYIDRETFETMRITTEALDIPARFPIRESRSALDYGNAKIGEQVYFLPRRSDLAMVSGGVLHRNVLEFGDYRKFSSAATITFDK